ncbi:MAG: protease complex subunit PrcB family protein [Syntrophaceae bacterium]|nr:protease complex subunit PrcB family protein [Syntrophaceae bacterium]
MNKFNIIILMAFSFLLMGCFYQSEGQNSQNSLSWEVLVKEKHCGIYEPRNFVIKSQEEFDSFWQKSQEGIDFGPQKPNVDFSKKWVIASFLGMVNTGGHSLEIQSIKTGHETTMITIIHKRPSSECLTAQVIEYPYIMASVDHFIPEKVEFKTVVQEIPCE